MLYVFSLLIISVNAAFDQEIHSKFLTLHRDEFVEYFNNLNLTWKIKNYKEERQDYGHCSFIDDTTYPRFARHAISTLNLPDTFDARDKWPQCASIGKIHNQKNCGSCWAFSTANTASDRICIHENIQINLSEQDLSCCSDCFCHFCSGGFPGSAFQFWIDNGLVTYDCQPYNIDLLMKSTACTKTCVNGEDYNSVKNYGSSVYSVPSDEDEIKAELFNNGPIEATFKAYKDLYEYHQGVYVHTHGDYAGLHSVPLIGYGEENGVQYWLVANSWGEETGDKGFIKIKRYQPDLEFENYLLTVKPKRD